MEGPWRIGNFGWQFMMEKMHLMLSAVPLKAWGMRIDNVEDVESDIRWNWQRTGGCPSHRCLDLVVLFFYKACRLHTPPKEYLASREMNIACSPWVCVDPNAKSNNSKRHLGIHDAWSEMANGWSHNLNLLLLNRLVFMSRTLRSAVPLLDTDPCSVFHWG